MTNFFQKLKYLADLMIGNYVLNNEKKENTKASAYDHC